MKQNAIWIKKVASFLKIQTEKLYFILCRPKIHIEVQGVPCWVRIRKGIKEGCRLYTSRRIMNWGWVQKDRKVGASRLVHALEISTDLEFTRRGRHNWGVA